MWNRGQTRAWCLRPDVPSGLWVSWTPTMGWALSGDVGCVQLRGEQRRLTLVAGLARSGVGRRRAPRGTPKHGKRAT
jgi:hypothetical protein